MLRASPFPDQQVVHHPVFHHPEPPTVQQPLHRPESPLSSVVRNRPSSDSIVRNQPHPRDIIGVNRLDPGASKCLGDLAPMVTAVQ